MSDDRRDHLRAALHEVPVPAGLAERLLAHLAIAEEQQSSEPSLELLPGKQKSSPPEPMLPTIGPASRRWTRRALLSMGGLATAAGIALAISHFNREPVEVTTEELLQASREVFEADAAPSGKGLDEVAAPDAYPVGRFVVAGKGTRWHRIASLLGRNGVAYELTAADGSRAALYVVRLAGSPQVQVRSNRPPPPQTTGGCSCGAWATENLLYVLVAAGNEAKYQGFLRQAGPLS